MRLIRSGADPSDVGADVRAALSAWGHGDAVLGGVALLGVRPPDCPRPLDAVVLLPRGVLVVVGVDLPDPAMRLEAPLHGVWKIDGWPLKRADGAVSPAAEALEIAATVGRRIQSMRAAPLPVATVVAVGPYVAQVVQPSADLNRGVRVLHPKTATLLAAARELAVGEKSCSAPDAERLLAALAPGHHPPGLADLLAEGFADVVSDDLANASTMLIPRLGSPKNRRAPRWALYVAVAVVGLLAVVGVAVGVSSGDERDAATTPSETLPTTVVVDGANFTPRGTAEDGDCAEHAFGDVQVWLRTHGCRTLKRAQYETTVAGRRAAVAVAELRLDDAEAAAALNGLLTAPGSGGVTPLVEEGRTWDGGPETFDSAAFTSTAKATAVVVAQAVWTAERTTPDDPNLTALATRSLRLPTAP
ncbi:hypothetical protein [Umezawaea beigongshangensis]|uniref:hypothetical protein n=1 Tax=Umezawaea beigongshangensis TaxID=2780383 RepID=UPI0018F1AA1A|nr:hypothetical protein [Umezawaea beigongshangensis]